MNKKGLFLLIFIFYFAPMIQAELKSLSEIFELKKGLLDKDGDSLADKVALRIVVPDLPTPHEMALASDIAARANLESLIVDFGLVQKESERKEEENEVVTVHISARSTSVEALLGKRHKQLSKLNDEQGVVQLFIENGQKHIIVTAGSQQALLKTGRAFFLRWPYLWDIWGREEGETYQTVERDLKNFLKETGTNFQEISVEAVEYEFAQIFSPHDAVKRLQFNSGEIKNLKVKIKFSDRDQMEHLHRELESLKANHKKGKKTDVLSYAGCKQISFELQNENSQMNSVITRVGYPKRILTPSYRSPVQASKDSKDFDLLSLFSPKGLLSDSNGDGHADGMTTRLVVPEKNRAPGTDKLASRLVLDTSGASFPLVRLDSEIENAKSLTSPVFIGQSNIFVQELIKTAKLKPLPLEKNQGYISVIPQAFNNSSALVLTGPDEEGLEKALGYLGQTFPYLVEFQEGEPRLHDVCDGLNEFLQGKRGSSEAYFTLQFDGILDDFKEKEFESFSVQLFLPEKNIDFEKDLQDELTKRINTETFQYEILALRENKLIFEKKQELLWEKEVVLHSIEESIEELKQASHPLQISIGVSESPIVRKSLESEIREILNSHGIEGCRVDVHSSYKQGYFWITERIIPLLRDLDVDRLLIRFAEEPVDLTQPKRFYNDPCRWLQELYPVDEIISKELKISLENIEFEKKTHSSPVYEFFALDKEGQILFKDSFSPRTRLAHYLKVLPEWGKVKLTTGWITVFDKKKVILDSQLMSDLERFWDFYQTEILPEVYAYILKKTGNEPSFQKQPYFKRLLIELWLSEPDFRLGLDEELISSLESIHDEIYFDTLDFIRGITDIELEDESLAEDSSRYSAPGNILPLIHPSLEGAGGRAKVVFEDWQAQTPQMILKWKEKGKNEITKKILFPKFKTGNIRALGILYNGEEECIEQFFTQVEILEESDYTSLIDIIARFRKLREKNLFLDSFKYPGLKSLNFSLKYKDLTKEEILGVSFEEKQKQRSSEEKSIEPLYVPTDEIISPQACLEITKRLGDMDKIKAYIAGKSYENRQIPVLEISTPNRKYTSLARLVTFKPTLYISGRQHANEISATNYILKFAEIFSSDDRFSDHAHKINFVLHPMENPDGAALACKLQEITPDHSLHAGRYTSLGIDVGYQVSASKPLLPEAKVRAELFNRWLPDIYLNLHGYPSHEWVQQFSSYTPYLFRDYWIPRGWFAYYRSLTLPIYQQWKEAAEELKRQIIQEMASEPIIFSSNQKFYDRYYRWAARWHPHMNYLERHNGLNLYAKRRSSREPQLTARRQLTFVEETPELMDETARGPWLDFLVQQGLRYLWAHVKYLYRADFAIVRIEEETQDHISIRFVRGRPGISRDR